ncbi:MAG: cell division protein FtsB [Verrucomicrobiales bacterium]|jgi:cell division protein FtsB
MSGPARLMIELVALAIVAGACLSWGNDWRLKASEYQEQIPEDDKFVIELYRKLEKLEKRNQQLLDEIIRLESDLQSR